MTHKLTTTIEWTRYDGTPETLPPDIYICNAIVLSRQGGIYAGHGESPFASAYLSIDKKRWGINFTG